MVYKILQYGKELWNDIFSKKSFQSLWQNLLLRFKKRPFFHSIFLLLIGYFFFFLLPRPLFDSDYSSLLYSSEGELLNAHIAEDEQWRFPKSDSIAPKIETCLLHFEDEYFYYHWGINPISFVKALKLNLKKGKNSRGASTLTMQVVRLFRNHPPRTYLEKLYEILLAFRLECTYSKKEILKQYLTHAPFGGNIVGVETASWRYFGRKSQDLSWAESATLAILPNAPSVIYPGKNQNRLLAKRNQLLLKLYKDGEMSQEDYELAIQEAPPQRMYSLPNKAPHLLNYTSQYSENPIIYSTLQAHLQQRVQDIVALHHQNLKQNFIQNIAALVIDTKTGQILAYIGNAQDSVEGAQVDMIHRPRSSGSTLKPFLYASMMDEGALSPQTILPDIPMDIGGYQPQNSNHQFDGIVMAKDALTRSLNIPWIMALRDFGYEKFYHTLQKLGFSFFDKSARHYGLSLVVGGGDVSMLQLANAYRNMALKTLDIQPTKFPIIAHEDIVLKESDEIPFSKAACYTTLETLSNVVQPENELGWIYQASQKLAWKTGTSHGFKDAWAVGVNANYTLVVWAGNAEGLGRPNLTGIKVAAPVLFDILNILPKKENAWFPKPSSQLKQTAICAHSGAAPTSLCPQKSYVALPAEAPSLKLCKYHRELNLNEELTYQVNSNCYEIARMRKKVFFVLPSIQAYYYKAKNPFYMAPPPYLPDCGSQATATEQRIQIQFPLPNATIRIPQVENNKVVFKAVSQHANANLYWYVDKELVATTQGTHHIALSLNAGTHLLAIQDASGHIVQRTFHVVR